MNVPVVIGQTSSPLAHHLAGRLTVPLTELQIQQFADSEVAVRVACYQKRAETAFLIYQFFSRQQACYSINDMLIGLLSALHKMQLFDYSSINMVLPYMPYSRQDTFLMVARLYQALNVKRVITCQLHDLYDASQLNLALDVIDMAPFWADVLRQNMPAYVGWSDVCIVSPDEGGKERAAALALQLGACSGYMVKKRTYVDCANVYQLYGDVDNKIVVLYDDIIDTGKTAFGAYKILQKHHIKALYGCFTHAIFAHGAENLIKQASFDQIFITDTLLQTTAYDSGQITVVSVSDFITNAII